MVIFMGIFNMFIVVPQNLNMITIPFLYNTLLGGDPTHALAFAGCSLGVAAIFSYRLKIGHKTLKAIP